LIVLGLFTRLAAIPLLIDISAVIASTKIPILLGHDYWRFHLPQLSRYGPWAMFSEARTDFSMLLGLVFLPIVGTGLWSFDARRSVHRPGIRKIPVVRDAVDRAPRAA
jgi:putative oxidoreductase